MREANQVGVFPMPATGSMFGTQVAISNDYAISSSPGSYYRAFIYKRNSQGVWNNDSWIVAPATGTSTFFGNSVDISGDYAVIGDYSNDLDANNQNYVSSAGADISIKKTPLVIGISIRK